MNQVEFQELIKEAPNFQWAVRIPSGEFTEQTYQDVVVKQGLPLVLSNTMQNWPQQDIELFSLDYLRSHFYDLPLEKSIRDVESLVDLKGTLGSYIDYILSSGAKERLLYGKDVPCPDAWSLVFRRQLPAYFTGSVDDIMNDLPREHKCINLMIYIGDHQTRTPVHEDICGSLGHNTMVAALSPDACAYWILIRECDRSKFEKVFYDCTGGGVIDDDTYYIPVHVLANRDFPVYVVQQRLGDTVFVPGGCIHQVINFNGITIKVAWNRILASTIKYSLNSLRRYHNICKPEVYRVKASIFYSLSKKLSLFEYGCLEHSQANFLTMLELVREMKQIIEAETVFESAQRKKALKVHSLDDERLHSRVCDFCGCDLWNRFFHCRKCEDCDLCVWCVAEGRNCIHRNQLQLYEYYSERNLREFEVRCTNFLLKMKSTIVLTNEMNIDIFSIPKKNSIASEAWLYANAPNERLYCHQCKFFLDTSVKSTCSICDINYCGKCIWKCYQLRPLEVAMKENFVCPRCQCNCTCQSCLLERHVEHKEDVKPMMDDIYLNQYRVPSQLFEEKPFLVPSVCDRIVNCAMNFSMKGGNATGR